MTMPTELPGAEPGASDLDAGADDDRRAQPSKWLGQSLEAVEILALALLIFIGVRLAVQNSVVEGASMTPTFHDGEFVLVNKLAYQTFDVSWLPLVDAEEWTPFGTPSAGDVVVFESPGDPSRDFIKRIVATEGQTVEVRGGRVYIDGLVQDEPYLAEPPVYEYGPITVPPGGLFVLGDNRNSSYDSHSWGPLDADRLIGRADFRYWPFDRLGPIDRSDTPTDEAPVVRSMQRAE